MKGRSMLKKNECDGDKIKERESLRRDATKKEENL